MPCAFNAPLIGAYQCQPLCGKAWRESECTRADGTSQGFVAPRAPPFPAGPQELPNCGP